MPDDCIRITVPWSVIDRHVHVADPDLAASGARVIINAYVSDEGIVLEFRDAVPKGLKPNGHLF